MLLKILGFIFFIIKGMFLLIMRMFVNMVMIFFEDNEDDCEYDDFCVDNEDVLGGVVCEEHLNKSSIAGLRPFQNCRQVL